VNNNQNNNKQIVNNYNNFDKVFSEANLINALNKCSKGVRYKYEVQKALADPISFCMKLHDNIIKTRRLPKLEKLDRVIIRERGKEREIDPVPFTDRVVQSTLCANCLNPLITKHLIYDNGASQKGKGVDFARQRVVKFLRDAIKDYGNEFYILQYDFKDFFKSIPHKLCYNNLCKYVDNAELIRITMDALLQYQLYHISRDNVEFGEKLSPQYEEEYWQNMSKQERIRRIKNYEGYGLSLGSEVSQVMAILAPNDLDHYIKDYRGMKRYVRYMDDGIIIAQTKEELWDLYDGMLKVVEKLGLKFNKKKTKVVKATKGFTFMKIKYRVDKNNKLSRALVHDSIVRERRRLKKLKRVYDRGECTLDDVYASTQSWFATARYAAKGRSVKEMERLYNQLFGGYKITKSYRRRMRKYKLHEKEAKKKESANKTDILCRFCHFFK